MLLRYSLMEFLLPLLMVKFYLTLVIDVLKTPFVLLMELIAFGLGLSKNVLISVPFLRPQQLILVKLEISAIVSIILRPVLGVNILSPLLMKAPILLRYLRVVVWFPP